METIIGIKVNNRFEKVERLQDILTGYGHMINTRLGIHSPSDNPVTSNNGLILLQLKEDIGDKYTELESSLNEIGGVQIEKMIFS